MAPAKVSIVIPCRNEECFIGECLDSVLANDYPKDLMEVLVVDGMSEDGTRSIVADYSRRFPLVTLVENPRRVAPAGFNAGVQRAAGDLVMIMGAHNTYTSDYISKSVDALERHGADNVGGIIKVVPRRQGFVGKALAQSLSHRFGVGNAHFRCQNPEPKWVDTVFGGCYRKSVFERVGLFNEGLVCNQDIEFNLRLRRAGGRILLVPDIVSHYQARSDLKSFVKHNFRNGSWAIRSFLFCDGLPVSWRHLVPLAFVSSLAASGALSLDNPFFTFVLFAIAASYLAASLIASAAIARKQRDARFFVVMPLAFGMLHLAYGTGSLNALAAALLKARFWKNVHRCLRAYSRRWGYARQ